eukprot:1159403-Pelagomonas_calceolata.AAC.3
MAGAYEDARLCRSGAKVEQDALKCYCLKDHSMLRKRMGTERAQAIFQIAQGKAHLPGIASCNSDHL